jgi:hypothetical protein
MSKVVWITASPRDPATGAVVTVRLAGGGRDAPYYRAPNHFRAGVATLPRFKAELQFDENGWTGGTVAQSGRIAFRPAQEALTAELSGLYWNEAPIEVDVGPEGGPYTRVLTGIVASVAAGDIGLDIEIADLSTKLNNPLITARFAGNGGVEGGAEASGRTKRRSWGRVFNVEGRVLDKATNLYEFGDPAFPWQGFSALRDMGRDGPFAVLPWQGSILDTLNALKASSPAPGGGVVAPSIACAKWWTQPVGPLTADVLGEIGAAYVEKVPEIAERLVLAAGGPAIANVAATAVLRPDPAGLHVSDNNETTAAALDRLLLGTSLLWVLEPAGTIRLREWKLADPVETIVSRTVTRLRMLPPTKTRRVGFQKSNRVHSEGEIAAVLQVGDIEGLGDLATADSVKLGHAGVMLREDGVTPLTDASAVTALGTASAIAGQGSLATLNSVGYGSPNVTGFGTLAARATVRFGTEVVRADGSTVATDAMVVTNLGTAAAITGQGTGATANTLAQLDGTAGARLSGIDAGATLADNFIQNGFLLDGSSGFTLASMARQAASSTDPIPFFFERAGGVVSGAATTPYRPAPASTSLWLSLWVYAGSAGQQTDIGLQWYAADGAPLSAVNQFFVAPTAGWHFRIIPMTKPANASYYVVGLANYAQGMPGAGRVGGIRLAATAPGATVGATAGSNLYRTDGSTVMTQAEVRTPEGTAASITGQGAFATLNSFSLEDSARVTNTTRISRLSPTTGRVADPTIYNTSLLLGVTSTTNLAPSYVANGSNWTVNLPSHVRKIAGPSGAISLSYGDGSGVVAPSTFWLAYILDVNLVGAASPTINFTTNKDDLLQPGAYLVASGTSPATGTANPPPPGTGGGGGGDRYLDPSL